MLRALLERRHQAGPRRRHVRRRGQRGARSPPTRPRPSSTGSSSCGAARGGPRDLRRRVVRQAARALPHPHPPALRVAAARLHRRRARRPARSPTCPCRSSAAPPSIERAAEHWFTAGPRGRGGRSPRPPCPGCCRRSRSTASTTSTAASSTRSRSARAVELGAERIFVLQVGRIETAARLPKRPWEVARVAFEIARRHRFARELAAVPDGVGCTSCRPAAAGDARRLARCAYRELGSAVGRRIEPAHLASAAYLARAELPMPCRRWSAGWSLGAGDGRAPVLVVLTRAAAGSIAAAAVVAVRARPAAAAAGALAGRASTWCSRRRCSSRCSPCGSAPGFGWRDPAPVVPARPLRPHAVAYLAVMFRAGRGSLRLGSTSRATRTAADRPAGMLVLAGTPARATRSSSSTRWSTGTTASRGSCSRTRCSGIRPSTCCSTGCRTGSSRRRPAARRRRRGADRRAGDAASTTTTPS